MTAGEDPHVIKLEPGHINLSPVGFRLWALDYFKCLLDFQQPRKFSVLPYFLCCRAMELALKARHLEKKSQLEVKRLYSHDLSKLYSELDADQQTLSSGEVALLTAASEIYFDKDFEYPLILDAVSAYKRFPDLDSLSALARKIVGYDA